MANTGAGGVGGGSSGAGGFAGRTSFGADLIGGQPGGGAAQLPTIQTPEEEEEERARLPIADANVAALRARAIDEALGQPEGTPFAADPGALPAEPPIAPPAFGPPKLLTTGSTTSSQRVIPTAAEKGLLADAATLGQQQVAQTQQLAEARAGQREGEVQRAEIEAEQRALQAQEQQDIIDRGRQLISRRESESKEAAEAASNFKIGQFFDDKPTSQRVITGLAIALGEIGRGLSGGQRNVAFEIFQDNVQQFQRQQEQKLAQLRQREASAERGVDRASASAADDLRTLQIKQAGFWKKVEADARASLARQGMGAAAIEDNLVVTQAAQAANERLRAAEAPFRRQVSTTVQKQLVGGGGAAAGTGSIEQNKKAIEAINALPGGQGKIFLENSQAASNYGRLGASLEAGIKSGNENAIKATLRLVASQINGGVLSDTEGKQLLSASGGILTRTKEGLVDLVEGRPSGSQLNKWLQSMRQSEKAAADAANRQRPAIQKFLGASGLDPGLADVLVPSVQVSGGQARPAATQGPGLSREVVQQAIAIIKADPESERAKRGRALLKQARIPF